MSSPQEPTALDPAQLRLLGEHLPLGTLLVQGERLWLNQRACDLIGYTSSQITTLDDWFNRLFRERAAQAKEACEADRQAHSTWSSVHEIVRGDDTIRQVEITGGSGDGSEIWMLRDVTEEQRLGRLRQQIQYQAGMGSWELDCRTLALYWSPEIYQLFELDPKTHTPHAFDCLQYLTEESQGALREALRLAMERAIPFDLEVQGKTAKGKSSVLHCRGRVETDATGKAVRLYGWCEDVSKQKEVQRARELLEAQVRQAQKLESLSVLAGGIAHDFNNLLTTILGYTSLARMELPAESHLQEFLLEVEKASRRAAELTQQMLAYSGKGRYILVPVRLDDAVRDVLPLLNATVGKRAELNIHLPPDLPLLEADVNQLRQILISLISNAAEAMDKPEGRINLRASKRHVPNPGAYTQYATTESQPGWFMAIEIEDNGTGMSPEIMTRLFDPFFSTKFAGRGLGMAAVLGIVKGHKGLIRVESERGQGTRLEVLFPLHDVTDGGRERSSDAPPPSPLVLVVEDEEAVRNLTLQVLQSGGYRVIAAVDGFDAENVFRQRSDEIDAVLLDLVMPRRGGEETLRVLRSIRPHIPIFLMSGYTVEELGATFPGPTPDAFLQKPFARDDLLNFFRQHLQQK